MIGKTRIFALGVITLMLVAFFSNPKNEQHERAIKDKATSLLKQQVGKQDRKVLDVGIKLFGSTLIDRFMRNHVQIENYYLFSLIKIRIGQENHTLGGGAFGTIWLSPKIDEKVAEIAAIIKEDL